MEESLKLLGSLLTASNLSSLLTRIWEMKALFRVLSDHDGNYEAIVDAPKGYAGIGISVAGVDNPAFHLVYRGYDVYKNGEKVNYCCTVKAGGKARYDFKVFK